MLMIVCFALEAYCLLCSFEEEILMLQPPTEKHEVNTEIPKTTASSSNVDELRLKREQRAPLTQETLELFKQQI